MSFFNQNSGKSKKGLWLLAFSISTTLSATAFAQSEIDYVNAVFAVSYNNAASTGDANLTIRNNQTNYDVNFSLNHSLLDAKQSARFTAQSCKITPQSYRSGSQPVLRSNTTENLDFNWANKSATRQHSKDGTINFKLSQHVYDPMSLYFKARCDLMAGQKQLSYPLIYKGRQTTHQYHVIGTETVKTGVGEFDALVVQRQRSNNNRRTTFYVAPALDYLIVKIHHRESSLASVSMTLKSLDYKTK
ncbi:MAG: DUF3108 domain-containing protein [Alcaligenaceae bacterium]|nr:DUF3108 domain-containing protein [Alcaligenaceae bacterium]